jgi:hypothetical protein
MAAVFSGSQLLEEGSWEFHNMKKCPVAERNSRTMPQSARWMKQGFNGPEEGGFAPNMAVVTADCSQFVCEIPYGGELSNGAIREQIFRQKIAVIKKFLKAQAK